MTSSENYKLNLNLLKKAEQQNLENDFIVSGIICHFRMQTYFAWKVLAEMLGYKEDIDVVSPRKIVESASKTYSFMDEKVWLDILADYNDEELIYDKTQEKELVKRVIEQHIPTFCVLEKEIEAYPCKS